MNHQNAIRDSDVIEGLRIGFLKILGMWKAINEYRTTGRRTAVVKSHVIGTLLITIPYVACQVQSFFNIEFDIQKVTFLYLHPLPALSLCCRILIFWFRMESMCRLYNLMRNDFFKIPQSIRADVRKIYRRISRMTNMSCILYLLWNAGVEILYLFFPGVSVDYIQHHKGSMTAVKSGRKKILGGWYPLPMSEYPYYEIIFVYESICLIWAATLLAVYFCMFFQLLMCLYAQFVVLGFRLSSLKVDPVETDKERNIRICEELHEILLEHQKIIRYTNELKSIYNPMVTITLGIGIIILIFTAVQILLGKTSDPYFIFQIFQEFSFQFIEVSLLCLGSSLIETASSDLQFAIYCSGWYEVDVKFRKAAQMLMIRASRNTTLTAIRMYPINLETLETIIRFTYSATALTIGMVK